MSASFHAKLINKDLKKSAGVNEKDIEDIENATGMNISDIVESGIDVISLKKALGLGTENSIELTPEEQKELCKEWVGKCLNNKHDLKDAFGKVTASWYDERDGTTHVRLTTGDDDKGSEAARKIANGEITSVSAGWEVEMDKNTKEIMRKSAHHVALTNKPAYEGMIIYGCASNDLEEANEIVRKAGGISIIPLTNANANLVLEKRIDTNSK
jgi:hypothetical protein